MVNQAVLLYQEFVHRNAEKFMALKSLKNATTEELTQLYDAASSEKLPENPAVLYDSLSNMIKLASAAGEVDITENAKKVLDKIEKETTFDDANSALLEYSKISMDTAVLPNMMINLCDVINQNLPKAQPNELEALVNPLCIELQTRIQSTIKKMSIKSTGFRSIGQDLQNAFDEFIEIIKKKVAPKIIAFVKKIMDLIEKLYLMVIENKLHFANKVSELARKNRWNLKEVVIEMPEFNINSMEILGFKVPFPSISAKGSVVFTPLARNQ